MLTADGDSRAATGWRIALSVGIAAGFIGFVEWYIGWAALLRPWHEIPSGALVIAVGLLVVTHGFRALRVHDYFGSAVRSRRLTCLRLVLQHNLFNTVLPMRSGELAFPVLMKRRFGIGPFASLPGLLLFRLLDLHTLGLIVIPVLLLSHLPAALLMTLMVAWLLLPWLLWRMGARGVASVEPDSSRAGRLLHRILQGLPQDFRVFLRTQAWTLINWTVKLAVFAWVLLMFAPLPPGLAVLGAIGGEITSVLPIHGVGGFGTYEAGIVAPTLPSGLEPEVLLRAAINMHLFVLGVTLTAGGLAFSPWPKDTRNSAESRPNRRS